MKLKLIIVFLTCLLFCLVAEAQTPNGFLQKLSAEKGFSGAVLIVKNKKILLNQGYGWANQKSKSRVKNNTKFYIASITKQFTASAILKLQEQGKLSIADSITKFFKDVPPDKQAITIHHLLSHTAGLAQNYAADGIENRDAAIKSILTQSLKNPVGEKFGYTNDDYNLLAAIVEIVSGQTYEKFLRKNLLIPARMLETGFWKEKAQIAGTKEKITIKPDWGFRGATGMFSTVGDLYKWQQSLFTDKILTKASREKLLAPNNETSRGKHAYGWFISKSANGLNTFWTAGYEDFGHNGMIKVYSDGTVIIVLTNSGDIDEKPARDVVIEGLEPLIWTK